MNHAELRERKAPSSPCMVHTIQCAVAEDLIDELLPTRSSWLRHHSAWTFRGQSDAEWPLQASIFRDQVQRHAGKDESIAAVMHLVPAQVSAGAPSPSEHVKRELGLVMEYCEYLEAMGLAIPFDSPRLRSGEPPYDALPAEFPPPELRAMFALAQHYGIPTRLLDWTSKPLVAAYFAAVGVARKSWEEGTQTGRHLAVWALNGEFKAWLGTLDPGVEFVSAPSASNPNLRAQSGRFTLVRYSATNRRALHEHPLPVDSLLAAIPTDGVPKEMRCLLPVLVKLTLPATEARSLLRLLANYDVTAAEVYPGHAGAAEAMREQKWMQWAREGERS